MAFSYTVFDHSGIGSYAGEEYSWQDSLYITQIGASDSGATIRLHRRTLGNNINVDSTTIAFTCDGQIIQQWFEGHNTPGYGAWYFDDYADISFPASWVDRVVSFYTSTGSYSGSFTFSGYARFKLTITASDKCPVTVSRTSSPRADASTGNLSSNADIYTSDVLKISYSAAAGYKCTVKLNSNNAANGSTHTVNANVTIVSSVEPMATIHRFDGSKWETYLIYFGSAGKWELGQANIFDGKAWNKYF